MTMSATHDPIADSGGRCRLDAVVEALRNAGASDEVVAAAVGAYGAWERAPRDRGRPRKYADTASIRPLGRAPRAPWDAPRVLTTMMVPALVESKELEHRRDDRDT
jgi:hypothetical protein